MKSMACQIRPQICDNPRNEIYNSWIYNGFQLAKMLMDCSGVDQ